MLNNKIFVKLIMAKAYSTERLQLSSTLTIYIAIVILAALLPSIYGVIADLSIDPSQTALVSMIPTFMVIGLLIMPMVTMLMDLLGWGGKEQVSTSNMIAQILMSFVVIFISIMMLPIATESIASLTTAVEPATAAIVTGPAATLLNLVPTLIILMTAITALGSIFISVRRRH